MLAVWLDQPQYLVSDLVLDNDMVVFKVWSKNACWQIAVHILVSTLRPCIPLVAFDCVGVSQDIALNY